MALLETCKKSMLFEHDSGCHQNLLVLFLFLGILGHKLFIIFQWMQVKGNAINKTVEDIIQADEM